MKKIIILASIIIAVSCCINGKNSEENIFGEWEELSIIEKDTVLFYPCDADNKKLNISKENIAFNYGQEELIYKILNFNEKEKKIELDYLGEKYILEYNILSNDLILIVFDGQQYLFLKETSTDKYKKNYQPCTECWDEADCDEDEE